MIFEKLNKIKKKKLKKRREVSEEEGKKFADENKMQFIEASAKTGDNVEDVRKKL